LSLPLGAFGLVLRGALAGAASSPSAAGAASGFWVDEVDVAGEILARFHRAEIRERTDTALLDQLGDFGGGDAVSVHLRIDRHLRAVGGADLVLGEVFLSVGEERQAVSRGENLRV
jgi:hypothetical protein